MMDPTGLSAFFFLSVWLDKCFASVVSVDLLCVFFSFSFFSGFFHFFSFISFHSFPSHWMDWFSRCEHYSEVQRSTAQRKRQWAELELYSTVAAWYRDRVSIKNGREGWWTLIYTPICSVCPNPNDQMQDYEHLGPRNHTLLILLASSNWL